MKLITAVIKPFKLDDVKEAAQGGRGPGMTVSEVQGFGRQGGSHRGLPRRRVHDDFVPKVKVEIVVDDADVDARRRRRSSRPPDRQDR